MAMNQLQTDLLNLLSLGKENQNKIIKRLDQLIRENGTKLILKWRNLTNNTKNTLLHELVERELPDVIRFVMTDHKLDINIQRGSDGLTPFQLASKNQNSEMCSLLKELGAEEILTEDVSKWLSEEDKLKSMNIAWVDLEMTSIEDPVIMECAIIITDKDLNELDRG
jgi:ankyrin repeat protein